MVNKIYIFTEGGYESGYGHITRCMALYEELEARGYNVVFIINGDNKVLEVIKDKNCILKDWRDKSYLSKLLTKKDKVIIDSYLTEKKIYDFIANIVLKALYIDDNMRIEYPRGIVVNPSIFGDILNYPLREDIKYLLGSKYIVLRKEFLSDDKKNRKDQKIKDILITIGGSDPFNITPKILKELKRIEFVGNKHIVIGKGFNNLEEIKNEIDEKSFFYFNLNAHEMKELMIKVDLAITGAGQTTYELIKVKLPFVPILVADNQKNNINGLLDKKIVKYWLSINNIKIDLEKIVFDYEDLIDKNGVARIVDELNKGIYIRKAVQNDIENVYKLSNLDYVRKYSINNKKIEWENHVKWFVNEIKNEKVIFYIIENEKREFLGQVHFELKDEINTYHISISLSEEIKGKKLGKTILKQVLDKFKNSLKNRKVKISAIINRDNLASIKIFESNGFKKMQNDGDKLYLDYMLEID